MSLLNAGFFFSRKSGLIIIILLCSITSPVFSAEVIQFNTDVLDLEDKNNIDLERFSQAGYVMPGVYSFTLKVNNEQLSEIGVPFYASADDPKESEACLSPEVVNQLGLQPAVLKDAMWWHNNQCLMVSSIPGMQVRGDLSASTLYVSIPQVSLEYSGVDWDPPSRWDNGISALILDYSVNSNINISDNGGHDSYALNGNGVAGVNLGVWRLRADWQGRLNYSAGSGERTDKDFNWNRFYAYRALPDLAAKLVLGEDYLVSDIFDSFRFIGASIRSDLNMLPPNLRGYSPEVTGIANTNATVTVSQQGRVLYETQVAPGPFRIQDLNDVVNGRLDITVREQDGSVQEYQMDTATIPYLTRPGQVRYKLASGRPAETGHRSDGNMFVTGEFSWGVNNGWSLFGGSLNSKEYHAESLGIGRDLLIFGALSFDITHSFARLPEKTVTGGSYRINYSKQIEAIDGAIQFAGYRFSERDFMTMTDFLEARKTGVRSWGRKELYTVSVNKNFSEADMSLYLNYDHQTYWSRPDNDYYSIMLSKYADIGPLKNVSFNLSANRSISGGTKDDSVYLSVSIPLNNDDHMSYSVSHSNQDTTNNVTYYNRLDDRTTYQITAGGNRNGVSGSGFITYEGDIARLTANTGYQHNQYSSFGVSANGGVTLTAEGGGVHRINMPGDTRMLVDTDGVADVPVNWFGAPVTSNSFGKAVVGVNSYHRNKVQVDLNALPDNVDVQQSVVQASLTEGAVGYRHFVVVGGQKSMAVLRLPDGDYPPFGAQVQNSKGQNTGIVGDAGSVYISGINPKSEMVVTWSGDRSCRVVFPDILDLHNALLLPCMPVIPAENSPA